MVYSIAHIKFCVRKVQNKYNLVGHIDGNIYKMGGLDLQMVNLVVLGYFRALKSHT